MFAMNICLGAPTMFLLKKRVIVFLLFFFNMNFYLTAQFQLLILACFIQTTN